MVQKHIIHPGSSFSTFLGWLSDPLERLSDQLDQKITLNRLDYHYSRQCGERN